MAPVFPGRGLHKLRCAPFSYYYIMKPTLTVFEKAAAGQKKLKADLAEVAQFKKEKAALEAQLTAIETGAAALIIGPDGEKLRGAIGLPKDAPASDVLKEVKDIVDDETDGNNDAEDKKEESESPASLTAFSKTLQALDPAARSKFYAQHAHRFGLEPNPGPDDPAAPVSLSAFMSQFNGIDDPVERSNFYNKHARRFGL
jgi:hypothetical protein